MDVNEIKINGILCCEWVQITVGNKLFYEGFIDCMRTSGTVDQIPVRMSERLYEKSCMWSRVAVTGKIITYNQKYENHIKVVLYVYVKDITETRESDMNEVTLSGRICNTPHYKVTSTGKEITNITLANHPNEETSSFIPCIFWTTNARVIKEKNIGTEIKVQGRLQSRIYAKEDKTHITYELSVHTIFN